MNGFYYFLTLIVAVLPSMAEDGMSMVDGFMNQAISAQGNPNDCINICAVSPQAGFSSGCVCMSPSNQANPTTIPGGANRASMTNIPNGMFVTIPTGFTPNNAQLGMMQSGIPVFIPNNVAPSASVMPGANENTWIRPMAFPDTIPNQMGNFVSQNTMLPNTFPTPTGMAMRPVPSYNSKKWFPQASSAISQIQANRASVSSAKYYSSLSQQNLYASSSRNMLSTKSGVSMNMFSTFGYSSAMSRSSVGFKSGSMSSMAPKSHSTSKILSLFVVVMSYIISI